jgi:hypothetical protein
VLTADETEGAWRDSHDTSDQVERARRRRLAGHASRAARNDAVPKSVAR